MKKLPFIVILALIVTVCKSEHAAGSFEEAKSNGIRITKLDSIYKNAVGAGDVVSANQEEKFIAAYKKMMQDLGVDLKKNGISFDQATRAFTGFISRKTEPLIFSLQL